MIGGDQYEDDGSWWRSPRLITVVVDNESWILPYAEVLVEDINQRGDKATLVRSHDEVKVGTVAFYLGCTRITPPKVLAFNKRNLAVHESDLPSGRGFAPLSWQIIEGSNQIPIVLLELTEGVDEGPIIYKELMRFDGYELIDEIRACQGAASIRLCLRYLASTTPPVGAKQVGEPSYFYRRTPKDSEINPNRSIAEQFNLLRTVDNDLYPAFFDIDGHRYTIFIKKKENI